MNLRSPQNISGLRSLSQCFLFYKGLLKKHEAFETDLEVHRERVQDIEDAGNKLIEKVNS